MTGVADHGDSRTPVCAPEDNAYNGVVDGIEEFVCWKCATPDERKDPAGNDAVGEGCARCNDVWWDWADAEQ